MLSDENVLHRVETMARELQELLDWGSALKVCGRGVCVGMLFVTLGLSFRTMS